MTAPPFHPPMTQIRLLKATEVCFDLAGHGALAITRVQLTPSEEDQTSLRTIAPSHPPITQILPL